jgi:hypothetical protein
MRGIQRNFCPVEPEISSVVNYLLHSHKLRFTDVGKEYERQVSGIIYGTYISNHNHRQPWSPTMVLVMRKLIGDGFLGIDFTSLQSIDEVPKQEIGFDLIE